MASGAAYGPTTPTWHYQGTPTSAFYSSEISGCQRLPNGNTVIASYGSKGPIKIFEVTPGKQIVWRYTGPHRAHEIQILTTNGQPVEGQPLK